MCSWDPVVVMHGVHDLRLLEVSGTRASKQNQACEQDGYLPKIVWFPLGIDAIAKQPRCSNDSFQDTGELP